MASLSWSQIKIFFHENKWENWKSIFLIVNFARNLVNYHQAIM